MDKSGSCVVLLDLPDSGERSGLARALAGAGLRSVEAPANPRPAPGPGEPRALSAGESLDAVLKREGADFLLVDSARWMAVRDIMPLPPRAYAVIVLISAEREGSVASLLEAGAFDYLVRGEDGFFERAAGYFRALSALRQRFAGAFGVLERRYEDLVHSLPDIVYELDDEGRFTFINNSVRLLGYESADLMGKHFSVLLHEEDAAVVDRESVLGLFRGAHTGPALSPKLFNERRNIDRRTENLEVRLRRRPGAHSGDEDMIVTVISYGEVTAAGEYARRDGTGEFMGSVGVIRDITLRRKSEDMLRKLYQAVDQLSAGVLVADRSFRVEYVNPAFFRISGRAPQEVIGSELLSFFALEPGRAEELRSLVREGFDARCEARLPRGAHAAESGQVQGADTPAAAAGCWTALHVSPVRSPAGTVTHAMVICEDISQRKAMEELVGLAREEAERANRAKSDFLASMSHELKSPVASVLAAARLIEMGGPEPERRAGAIIASAQGLLDMLGDILDFVRFETGTGAVRKFSFPLKGFVVRLCDPFRAAAEAKGLAFRVGELPDETISSDPDRLGRAISALLDNAVSFTERGRVSVEAALERRSGNVPYLVLSVSDTGTGIPAEEQGRIFAPFVQLASPYTKRGGAGIGLSLSRNIVRALGGEIRLQSEPGRGSTFTVLVPAGEPASAAAAEPSARRAYRLLVVDDNEVNLEYMAAILSNSGHSVDTASSGAEALGKLEARQPDAAILDIQMPGMSGIELGRKARAYAGDRYDASIPLVALTAFDPDEVQRSGVDFDAVFAKPVDVGKLLAALDGAVDRREAPDIAAFSSRWSGRGGEGANALSRAEAEVPGLLGELRASTAAGDQESIRRAARALGSHLERLGAESAEASLRRLVRAAGDEERSVLLCRVERMGAAWDALRASLGAGTDA